MEGKTICCTCGKVMSETDCPNCTGQTMCLSCGRRFLGDEVMEQHFGKFWEDDK